MSRSSTILRRLLLAALVVSAVSVLYVGVYLFGPRRTIVEEDWRREKPLVASIGVREVLGDQLVLSDGRTLRPAGIRKADDVSIEQFADALRALVPPGVVVVREFGGGTAHFMAEARLLFETTRVGRDVSIRRHIRYAPVRLSEFLVLCGYAVVEEDERAWTSSEGDRIRNLRTVRGRYVLDRPVPIDTETRSFLMVGMPWMDMTVWNCETEACFDQMLDLMAQAEENFQRNQR
jgi:hypothetical protein